MSHDQEHRLEEVFSAAHGLPPLERAAFLEQTCGGDAELRRQADSLLTAHDQSGQFLQPTVALSTPNALVGKSGDRIGRYKLLEQIGEGDLGVVWMAKEEEPVRRRVALKIIKLGMDTKEVVVRCEAERQALAMVDHPHIASVVGGSPTGTGRPYFVMELRAVRTVGCGTPYGTVATWDLAPEPRPVSQLLFLAQVLSAQRIDASRSLAPMGAEGISNAWWTLRKR
jgi:hypothetical protein